MRRVGYSEWRDFKKCPLFHHRRYRLREAEPMTGERQVQMATGTLIQRTVETFYRTEAWRQPKPLQALLQCLEQSVEVLGHTGIAEVSDMLPGVLETMRRERLVVPGVAVELPVSFVVQGVSIEGRVDLVLPAPTPKVFGQGATLLDGKAGSTADSLQLKVYAMALMSTSWGFPTRIGTWSYRSAAVQWLTFTRGRIPGFLVKASILMDRYVAGDRTPRVGSHCEPCGYRVTCEAYQLAKRQKQAKYIEVPAGGGTVSFEE